MARYIDVDKVLNNLPDDVPYKASVKRVLIQAPEEDVVEVVRCKDCKYAREFDKHCEINRFAYRHYTMDRGEEIRNVWHTYKKYYKDYSVVDFDGFCDYGKRKEGDTR